MRNLKYEALCSGVISSARVYPAEPGSADLIGGMIVDRSANIAIVDDDQDVRAALKNFLRSASLEVRTFDCAEAFLRFVEDDTPDCLVTDLHMPGIGGLALQEQLNRLGHRFPVIVMTAFPSADVEERCAGLGACAFLSKPIDPEQLLSKIEASLEDRQ